MFQTSKKTHSPKQTCMQIIHIWIMVQKHAVQLVLFGFSIIEYSRDTIDHMIILSMNVATPYNETC